MLSQTLMFDCHVRVPLLFRLGFYVAKVSKPVNSLK
jgi:hypothetical protein